MKEKIFISTIIFLVILIILPMMITITNAADNVVTITFQDMNLYNAIKSAISGKIIRFNNTNKTITLTQTNINNVILLSLNNKNISNLYGIDKFKNLQCLYLSGNNISSLVRLSSLTKMKTLNLNNNKIISTVALGNMTELQILRINNNRLKDIKYLEKQKDLKILDISNNQIEEIQVLEDKEKLVTLYASKNKITDLAPILKLEKLTVLDAKEQSIDLDLGTIPASGRIINLPPIFTQAKTFGSKIFTPKNFDSQNITVTSYFKKGILNNLTADNKQKTASLKIIEGSAADTVLTVKYINQEIPVTSIKLNRTEGGILEGNSALLVATIYPTTATNKNVKWSSNNTKVATVSQNGVVTAIKEGIATIRVQSVNGGKTAYCVVTVKKPVIIIRGIKLNKSELDLKIGETEKLYATIIPENATYKDVTWYSSNTKIVEVDNNGNVKAKAKGKATISVSTVDDDFKEYCVVTVEEQIVIPKEEEQIVVPTAIKLNKEETNIKIGQTELLLATIEPKNTTHKDITWYSSNTNIAEVDNQGLVKAKSEGTTIITAFTSGNAHMAQCIVNVEKEEITITITSNKYNINKNDKIIEKISLKTTSKDLRNNITVNSNIRLYRNNKELGENELIGTGTRIILDNNEEYVVIVNSDLNGDGKCTISDLIKIKMHIISKNSLTNEYLKAGDINGDEKCSISDMAKLKMYIIGKINKIY